MVLKSELQLQAECFQWLWNNYPQTRRCLFHVPNGGARSKREATQLKASGVVPGVYDMLFIWDSRVYAFEMKVGTNRQSSDQLKWGEAAQAQGVKTYEVRSLEQFQEIIKSIVI